MRFCKIEFKDNKIRDEYFSSQLGLPEFQQ